MRANLQQHKRALSARAAHDLPQILLTYEPANLNHLGRLCECVCQIDEYLLSLHDHARVARSANAIAFFKGEYRSLIVLVLTTPEQPFFFTLYDITRFIRGESIHGASDNRDKRRALLHSFIFETNNNARWVFIHSWNWIAGPNIGAVEGNYDSNGPFVHLINVNGRSIEVGLAESIVLRGAYELWQALSQGMPQQTTKTFCEFNPVHYESILGAALVSRLQKQLMSLGLLGNVA